VVLQGSVYEDETNRFDPALVRYKFPLVTGERWDQRLVDLEAAGAYGGITRHSPSAATKGSMTPAGTFDAIGLRVIMQMDDETFWRTHRMQLPRLVCAVGQRSVREDKRSQVARQRRRPGCVGLPPGQNATVELRPSRAAASASRR
jgi:hypothetical protein